MPQSPYIANIRWYLYLATGLLDLKIHNPYAIRRLLPGQSRLWVQLLVIPGSSEDAPGHPMAFAVLGMWPRAPCRTHSSLMRMSLEINQQSLLTSMYFSFVLSVNGTLHFSPLCLIFNFLYHLCLIFVLLPCFLFLWDPSYSSFKQQWLIFTKGLPGMALGDPVHRSSR